MSYEWDNKKPTAQMLGRWQPFHDGHYALFEEIIKKTGQVCIQIRDVQGVDDNPFDFETVKKNIEERLNPKIIDSSRKKRISGGSGADTATINKLLKQFKMMTNMMKKMSKSDSKDGIPPEIFNQLK